MRSPRPAPAAPPELLTPSDVAARLNISPRAARRLLTDGYLPYIEVTATCRRVPADALAAFIAARTHASTR